LAGGWAVTVLVCGLSAGVGISSGDVCDFVVSVCADLAESVCANDAAHENVQITERTTDFSKFIDME